MNQGLVKSIFEISGKSKCYDLVRAGLRSSYPLAVWRLPFSDTVYVLFDLTGGTKDQPIEELHQCFVINTYMHCHPPKPLILSGDVVMKISNDTCKVSVNPALSAEQIETFHRALNQPRSVEPDHQVSKTVQTEGYREKVSKAIEQIKSGVAQKIVLSRFEEHQLPTDFDLLNVFEEMTSGYPGAFCHLTSTEYGIWAGASPERLIAIDEGRYFQTDSLAGTQPVSPSESLIDVGWTQKEIEEQAMVSRYIINCFKKIRLREFDEIGPQTVRAGNLAHLKTEFRVDMEATNSPSLGSTMLELLHPTSAVCGYPRDAASRFIAEVEGYDRELYAGFLGPVGFNRSTRLYVNLRCMKIQDNKARLFAGGGITEYSVPEKEYAETVYKLQTLLSVLER